jgi:circadian clock protein KaiC
MLAEIFTAVQRLGATRVVIDSLSGFEIALAPTFRVDFRESLYRLVGALTATGVTIIMTAEVIEQFPGGQFTTERVSFITDDILVQRYVEIDGHIKKVVAVVKMRGSKHATDFRTYNITSTGAVLGTSLSDYYGITTGNPTLARVRRPGNAGLSVEESGLLDALMQLKSASAETLVKQTGMTIKAVRAGVARLAALGYIDEGGANGAEGKAYRAVAMPSGA